MDDPYGILSSYTGDVSEFLVYTADFSTHSSSKPIHRNICRECGTEIEVHDLEYECPNCQIITEIPDLGEMYSVSSPSEPGSKANQGRLRIVGSMAHMYQSDLDRTNPAAYKETQRKTIYNELLQMNRDYGEISGKPIPLNVLEDVALFYNKLQEFGGVFRSQRKREIIAALLYRLSAKHNFVRTKIEVTSFAQLDYNGIARGDDIIRSIDEDHDLGIDMNESILIPHINTTFQKLKLEGSQYDNLFSAVHEIILRSMQHLIGNGSNPRSKAVAATCEVLARGRDIMMKIDSCPQINLATFTDTIGPRKNTIMQFRNVLNAYKSLFVDIYEKYGLFTGPLSEIDPKWFSRFNTIGKRGKSKK